MKILLTGLILSSFVGFSQAAVNDETPRSDEYQGKNLVLNYSKPNGTITADFLKLKNDDISFEGEDVNAEVVSTKEKLTLKLNGLEFEISGGIAGTINGYDQASVNVESIETNSTYTELSSSLIDLRSDSKLEIRDVSLECNSGNSADQIAQCIESGVFSVNYILSGDNSLWKNVFDISIQGETEIENIFMETDNGSYTLTLKVLGFKVKVKGSISYANNIINIHVKSAKTGIISVKGRLLDEVRKLEGENLKVDGDRILITF